MRFRGAGSDHMCICLSHHPDHAAALQKLPNLTYRKLRLHRITRLVPETTLRSEDVMLCAGRHAFHQKATRLALENSSSYAGKHIASRIASHRIRSYALEDK